MITLFITVLSIIGCDKKANDCIETVVLDTVFSAKANCVYSFSSNEEIYNIKFNKIIDYRAYGVGGCMSTFGTYAQLFFSVNEQDFMFEWLGCTGAVDFNLTNPNLPSFQVDSFQIKMVNLYPLSENIDVQPSLLPIEDYEVRLGIVKN